MNQHLQNILNLIQQDESLSAEQKNAIIQSLKDADKELQITAFKLDRTEKVKRTTAILLEETIEELEQKRKDVEKQNRELEIESALERVRTIAMSMNRLEDMVDVCRIISQQLELLNVKEIRNVQTAIFYEKKGVYMDYEYYAKHDKTFITEVNYTDHTVGKTFAHQMLKGPGEVYMHGFQGKEVIDWYEYQKTTNVFIDTFLETANSLNYYWYSLGPVALGISTYYPLTEEETNLFKRFVKVFELSYRRYIDIELAISQAKEAQIELALERVRARTMAMQKSDELAETSLVLFQQFKDLGETSEQISIGIFKEHENIMELYSTLYGSQWKEAAKVDLDEPVVMKKIHTAWKEQNKSLVIDISGNELLTYNAYRKKLSNLEYREDRWVIHIAFFSKGVITFSTTEPHPLETIQLLERFAVVFDQTYTRFLDLQKAEAQARESQIQLAMERVRARTMAMQNSNELPEAANLLFQQVQSLGMPAWSAGYCIWDEDLPPGKADKKAITLWMSSEGVLQPPFKAPTTNAELFIQMRKGHEEGKSFHVVELGGDKLVKHYQYMRTLPVVGEILDSIIQTGHPLPIFQIMHHAYFSKGFLLFITYEPVPDAHDIFQRFANVFEQTYTRFLDLQKSEAQAREAQIQLALERVRARTMAMQKSEELGETAALLFQQLHNLGLTFWSAGIFIWSTDNDNLVENWMGNKTDGSPLAPMLLRFKEDDKHRSIYEASLRGELMYENELKGEALTKHYEWFMSHPSAKKVIEHLKNYGVALPSVQWNYAAIFKQGYLLIIAEEPVPEIKDIGKRFAKVFEQTYTRFHDLQKAEAQARESQIQLAMERVRARTMAMQRSEELADVATVLFQQVKALGVSQWACGFNIWESGDKEFTFYPGSPDGDILPPCKVPLTEHPVFIQMDESRKRGDELYVYEKTGEIQADHYRYMYAQPGLHELFQSMLDAGMSFPTFQIDHLANFSHGNLMFITYEPVPEMHDIFKRFAKVFEQTYTRFLDLQKVEAQAKEAQVELGLERVRARAMAMQHSDELKDLISTVSTELSKLDMVLDRCFIIIYDAQTLGSTWWMSNRESPREPLKLFVKYHEHPPYLAHLSAWRELKQKFQYILEGEVQDAWDEFLFTETDLAHLPEEIIANMRTGKKVYLSSSFNNFGYLWLATFEPLTDEQFDIMLRFAKVFDLTYTRFNDLKQAEAQARESQIQLAMERIRARTMAMQKSDELPETSFVLFQQVKELGETAVQNSIGIVNEEAGFVELSTTVHGHHLPRTLNVPIDDPYVMAKAVAAWKAKRKSLKLEFEGQELKNYNERRNSFFETKINFPEDQWIVNIIFFSKGWLSFSCNKNISGETFELLKRFAAVFEQTYTRFLDLQKAEAQARESQIQTALERVRAKSLGMHSSSDLFEVALTFREQMGLLGQSDLESSNIHFYNQDSESFEVWYTNRNLNHPDSPIVKGHCIVSKDACTWTREVIDHFNSSKTAYTIESKGEKIKEWYKVMEKIVPETISYDQQGQIIVPEILYYHFSKFSDGALLMITEDRPKEEAMELQQRAAHVFDFAYRRYLDLKQAEDQSREATIEAALERVRGKALAMHDSKDLSSTAIMVFTELNKLGIKPIRNGVGILSKDSRKGQLYSATSSNEVEGLALVGWVELSRHPILEKVYDSWYANEDYFPVLEGELLKTYYEHLSAGFSLPSVPTLQPEEKQYGHFIAFSIGSIYSWASKPYTEDEIKILKRFAAIIDLTFRRYLELQHSEANAKEAIKQSSLDRVRAEIASMRTVDDLNHITPIVWRELTTLGVPFFRCGIYIIKEDEQIVHIYLSTPEGKSLAVLHLPFTEADITVQTVHHWRKQQIYSTHWDQDQFINWVQTLQGQGQVQSAESYQGAQAPPESLTLQFIPFTQGMLYIGSADALNEDQLSLAKELANAFSVAYARYEDFKKLEEAKSKIETTLSDLKATQSQLVQSEKMASLGELTAGIAHEIQNPLNFVNNFAEINKELILELEEAASNQTRDASNEAEIIATIKENSEKINHHGKRAESIVRGMLQHSRKSTSIKEPTDINALADEFMRLSYHGLRAKDKSFNAEFRIELDPTLPLINVIPQDIGRVFLNLFNNAFWAANERKNGEMENGEKESADSVSGLPSSGLSFSPSVTLTTKNLIDHIEIRIHDNGPGIPSNIIDKIFQPFFTTKPTGQGTGLGLSLAYDIIKAHGGEINVISSYLSALPPEAPRNGQAGYRQDREPGSIEASTKDSHPGGELKVNKLESVGTEFTIILPV